MTTANGVEGLAQCQEHKSEIDLVITDVVIPKMTGHDLYKAVQDSGTEPTFLFMSGYSSADLRQGALLDRVCHCCKSHGRLRSL